jgi:hypothetical protein
MTRVAAEDSPVVLRTSKRKAALLFVGSGAFVTIGVFMVLDGERLGWFPAIFFGLGLIVSVVLLLPATSLTIDRHGIHMKHMFRLTHIRWSDVDSFYIGHIGAGLSSTKMIGVTYSASYEGQKAGRGVASALSGMEGAIPNQYEVSAEELCEILNNAKRRFG